MNRLENWFCASRFWQEFSARRLAPFLLEGVALGEHALELGAGAGAATLLLQQRAERVTALERDPYLLKTLCARVRGARTTVLRGDATALPFPDETFSSAVAVLVLHHIETAELQDRLFAEARRVLRPGGVFVALEVADGLLARMAHIGDTFVPLDRSALPRRLAAFGFGEVSITARPFLFRFRAVRA